MMAANENPESGESKKYCGINNEENLRGSYVKNRERCTNREDGECI
ncbi:MAG: hypothetical protein WC626_03370 [Methanoregula sp.]